MEQVCIAILDEARIYQGKKMIAQDELKPADVVIPAQTDLAPGGYRWNDSNPAHRHFEPVAAAKQAANGTRVVSADLAFYRLCLQLRNSGVALPHETQLWAEAFAKTVDSR